MKQSLELLLLLNSWHHANQAENAAEPFVQTKARDKYYIVGSWSKKQSHKVGILKNVRDQFLI